MTSPERTSYTYDSFPLGPYRDVYFDYVMLQAELILFDEGRKNYRPAQENRLVKDLETRLYDIQESVAVAVGAKSLPQYIIASDDQSILRTGRSRVYVPSQDKGRRMFVAKEIDDIGEMGGYHLWFPQPNRMEREIQDWRRDPISVQMVVRGLIGP
ncbi:MAG: hypothetical protein HYV38_00105, partial [Candidatus Levybacteria bacterium]|nr:hypothetical protein [Candidatus Levybacteria bacterium]